MSHTSEFLQSTLLAHAVAHVPFSGWSEKTLQAAMSDAGLKEIDLARAFPGGAAEAADAFLRGMDKAMLEALSAYHLPSMKVRERVATAVRVRLEGQLAQREAIRRTISFFAMPPHALAGLKALYRTVDEIWHAIGDTSTDFNFYTKRLMLAGVYTSTLLFWLDDKSPGQALTWAFLDRRIENVMQIEKAKAKLKKWAA